MDALYSRADYDYTSIRYLSRSLGDIYNAEKHGVDQVEIPALAKYYFPVAGILQPFLGAGGSVVYDRDQISHGEGGQASPAGPMPFFYSINGGLIPPMTTVSGDGVLAGGVVLSHRALHVSAEIRYTHLFDDVVTQPALHTNRNQLSFLLGILF
ncbi:MAG TPA: hypothetical protein VH640_07120 [Bryobacteraceae bacterium]